MASVATHSGSETEDRSARDLASTGAGPARRRSLRPRSRGDEFRGEVDGNPNRTTSVSQVGPLGIRQLPFQASLKGDPDSSASSSLLIQQRPHELPLFRSKFPSFVRSLVYNWEVKQEMMGSYKKQVVTITVPWPHHPGASGRVFVRATNRLSQNVAIHWHNTQQPWTMPSLLRYLPFPHLRPTFAPPATIEVVRRARLCPGRVRVGSVFFFLYTLLLRKLKAQALAKLTRGPTFTSQSPRQYF